MKNEKKNGLFLNSEKFKAEMKRHAGQTAPVLYTPKDASAKRQPHPARLDRQGEVAFLITASKTQMSNWLSGRETITIERLKALGDLFGCDWQYLCDLTEYRTREDEFKQLWYGKSKSNCSFAIGHANGDVTSVSVTCHDMPIEELIKSICRQPTGYERILKGLASIASDIKTD